MNPSNLAPEPSTAATEERPLEPFVWAVRRDLGRLLGAMYASGVGLDALRSQDQERLKRCESITGRFLSSERAMAPAKVRAASLELRAVEHDIVRRLGRAALAEIRRHEDDLSGCSSERLSAMYRTNSGESDSAFVDLDREDKSLAAGLGRLSHRRLRAVMERLGVSGSGASDGAFEESRTRAGRRSIERALVEKLSDEGLLRILVATLSADSHRLLRAILLEELTVSLRERLGASAYGTQRPGRFEVASPIQSLCECAIVFAERGELWIPGDLHAPLLRILATEAPKPRFLV